MLSPVTDRPTRVAWTCPALARSYYFQPVFKEFAKLFPESVIFTGIWPGFLRGYETAFRLEHVGGVKEVRFTPDPTGYEKSFVWGPPTIVTKLLRSRPDVVIVGGFNVWALYAALLKRVLRYRLVLFWDGNAPGITYERSRIRMLIRRAFGRCVDACITNTPPGAVYLNTSVGIPAERIIQAAYQVPAVDALCLDPVDLTSMRDAPRPMFLYVGQLIKRKGIHKLLEACGILVRRGLGGFSLALVGDGSDMEEFKRQAASLGLDRNVHWMGGHRYEQLGSFYKACDVFVLPSLEDCRPMVVSEAMAFGKAILCSRYTDLKEMVRHGENGFLMDAQRPEEIAGCMARFLEHPELIAKQGARSYEIIAPYNPVRAAESLAQTVLRALGRNSTAIERRA
jgi:glycosyltransferase involved in cell wall biosynthesis